MSTKRRNANRERAVRVYTPSLNLLGEFESQKQASLILGVPNASVSNACRGKGMRYLGLLWRCMDADELYAVARHDTVDLEYLKMLCSTNTRGTPRSTISQFTMDGEFIRTWATAKQIERELGLSADMVANRCKGIVGEEYGGFLWRYTRSDEDSMSFKVSEVAIISETSDDPVEGVDGEVWKLVRNKDTYAIRRYEVSNYGRVRRSAYTDCRGKYHAPHILQPTIVDGQTPQVSLCHGVGGVHKMNVHTLVADAFIPNPDGLRCIRHLDGDICNCSADNLKRCSNSEIALINGVGSAVREQRSKAVRQYSPYGVFIAEYPSTLDAERATGVASAGIQRNCKGECQRPTTCGFVWRYVDNDDLFELPEHDRIYKIADKVILQLTLDGKLVAEHPEIYIAQKTTGVGYSTIHACLHGKQKVGKGFIWRYAD